MTTMNWKVQANFHAIGWHLCTSRTTHHEMEERLARGRKVAFMGSDEGPPLIVGRPGRDAAWTTLDRRVWRTAWEAMQAVANRP